MEKRLPYTLSFEEETARDISLVGGKGACLAELYLSGFNVPKGFCVCTTAFELFRSAHGLNETLSSELKSINLEDPPSAERAAAWIEELILSLPMPDEIRADVLSSYRALISSVSMEVSISEKGKYRKGANHPAVAVRSSVVTRDLSKTSFPGQLETYLNLHNEEEVLKAVARCWASAFSYRSIINRKIDGIDPLDILVAPVVQLMVFPESSGVAFSLNPVDGNENLVVVDSTFGLGVGVVSGMFKTDHFAVNKNSGKILERKISAKTEICVCSAEDESGVSIVRLDDDKAMKPSLADAWLQEIRELAEKLEGHFGCPQDVEWAIADGVLYVLQSRPITGIPKPGEEKSKSDEFAGTLDYSFTEDERVVRDERMSEAEQVSKHLWTFEGEGVFASEWVAACERASEDERRSEGERVLKHECGSEERGRAEGELVAVHEWGAEDEWVSEFDSTVDLRYPLYTLSNISEVLPGVLTPLTLSGIDHLDRGFIETNRRFGLMKGINPKSEYTFLGVFYNRVHLNLSVVKELTSRIPGASAQEFERMLPAEGVREEGFRWSVRNAFSLLSPLSRITYRLFKTPREASKLRREIDERVSGESGQDIQALDYRDFLRIIEESSKFREEVITVHITASQFAVVFHDFLRKAVLRWFGEGGENDYENDKETFASTLLTGLSNIESAGPLTGIWNLSRIVAGSRELSEIFARGDAREVLERTSVSSSTDASEFRAALSRFLEKYGYRSVLEAELALPNWEDDPSFVISTIKNYLEVGPEYNPERLLERQRLEREKAKGKALGGLPFVKRMLFIFVLRQAQKYVVLREFTKATLIKGIARLKKYFHALANLMCLDGIIQNPGDMFFLTMEEVQKIASMAQDLKDKLKYDRAGTGFDGGIGGEIRREFSLAREPLDELIRKRKLEYERNKKVQLPEYSLGRPKPVRRDVEISEESGRRRVLRGIAVAPGKASGRARIIMDPRERSLVQPGEILVVPVTDAAWTPLFVGAKALVVDVGGPLSHGSIVAREIGIPAVVNVINGTRIIRDGDFITVDGSRGEVYVGVKESAEG